ncbi:MAG TPA: hypothetical protein VGO49_07630 [Bradyrhizobium sp.]|jgi:hypothetical protein|nr:hypothetical protein [Bradyrhizobium sp.]
MTVFSRRRTLVGVAAAAAVARFRVATPDGFRRVPRRYDRTTDSFVDVGPASPGIEEK